MCSSLLHFETGKSRTFNYRFLSNFEGMPRTEEATEKSTRGKKKGKNYAGSENHSPH